MVGDTGFEPATSRTRSVHASQLRQSPVIENDASQLPARSR